MTFIRGCQKKYWNPVIKYCKKWLFSLLYPNFWPFMMKPKTVGWKLWKFQIIVMIDRSNGFVTSIFISMLVEKTFCGFLFYTVYNLGAHDRSAPLLKSSWLRWKKECKEFWQIFSPSFEKDARYECVTWLVRDLELLFMKESFFLTVLHIYGIVTILLGV